MKHRQFFYSGVSRPVSAARLSVLLLAGLLLGLFLSTSAAVARPGAQVNSQANPPFYLPLVSNTAVQVSALLTPFDADQNDLNGPSSWDTNYGKTPEIIVASNGTDLDILAQDYNSATAWNAVLLHVVPRIGTNGYVIAQGLTGMPMLDRVMGLAIDSSGNRYYATAVDEDSRVNPDYPPLNTWRSNIVRVVKLNSAGNVLFNIDLDTARHAFNPNAEMIINPMVAASARLAVGGGQVMLVHGINTGPDWNIGGTRHQKALSTLLSATNGAILSTSSIWVSHSFDQRLMYDGSGIIETHLGDAYPREVVLGHDGNSHPLFYIKGDLGANVTATRLGDTALIQNDATYGYLSLFASEDSTTVGSSMISGPRNLAIVRANRSNFSIDPNLPDTLTVISEGVQDTNRLRWLTHYTAAQKLHAERPKLVGIGGDRYIVLWEQWLNNNDYWDDTFQGVYGMLIDAAGSPLKGPTLITSQHHLPRGDNAVLLDNRAAWVTGSTALKKLYIHFVDSSLNYQIITLD